MTTQYARVKVGVPGLNGGGVTSGELTAAVAGLAPADATYITQTSNGTLTNEQALGSLATGILKNTTTTGVLSIATGADLPSHNHTGVPFSITLPLGEDDGTAIDTGVHYDRGILIPVAATVTGWYLDGDGDIVITVQRAANATPGTFAAISGTEKPTLSGVTVNSDTSLSTWTTAIAALDRLRVSVDSATATVTSLHLLFTRTI